MSRLPRPCVGATTPSGLKETCGKPTTGKYSRCTRHQAMYDKNRRPSPSQRGYDSQYQSERAALLADHPVCELQLPGCTFIATTADHAVALAAGGSKRGTLISACAHCNSSKGAKSL